MNCRHTNTKFLSKHLIMYSKRVIYYCTVHYHKYIHWNTHVCIYIWHYIYTISMLSIWPFILKIKNWWIDFILFYFCLLYSPSQYIHLHDNFCRVFLGCHILSNYTNVLCSFQIRILCAIFIDSTSSYFLFYSTKMIPSISIY